jgi:hypothetical protein
MPLHAEGMTSEQTIRVSDGPGNPIGGTLDISFRWGIESWPAQFYGGGIQLYKRHGAPTILWPLLL